MASMSKTSTFQEGEGKYQLQATITTCGNDVVVVIVGGTRPHIGAVSLAISHPRLKDPRKTSATASVISVPGHKEDQLAREAALRLSGSLKTTVVMCVGIHIDDAATDEIDLLTINFTELINDVELALKKTLMI